MATTSIAASARAALVTALDAEPDLTGLVHYAWNGPKFETAEVVWIENRTEIEWFIPNMKAGRKQRQETVRLELVVWVSRPGLAADAAQTVHERAFTLLGAVENALADDVQFGDASVQWGFTESAEVDLVPYDKGWGCQIVVGIEINARLT